MSIIHGVGYDHSNLSKLKSQLSKKTSNWKIVNARIKSQEFNGTNFENEKKKLEIEALWNELVLIKFSSKIKINEENLKNKIQRDNNKFLKSYLLSEISFEISNLKDLDKKFIEIKKC